MYIYLTINNFFIINFIIFIIFYATHILISNSSEKYIKFISLISNYILFYIIIYVLLRIQITICTCIIICGYTIFYF